MFDLTTISQYFDYWFFIGMVILLLSLILSYWHNFNLPLTISAIAFSALLAVWGSNFYDITLKPFIDYLRFGGSIGLHNYGSMIYTIGFFAVLIVSAWNIINSPRGNPRDWK